MSHNNEQHDHDDLDYDNDGWSQPHHHGRPEHFHIDHGPTIYAHDVGHITFNNCRTSDVDDGGTDGAALIGEYGFDISYRTPRTPRLTADDWP